MGAWLIGLLLFLVMIMAACRDKEPASGASRELRTNILRYDVAAPFHSLNPREIDVYGSTMIFPLLYSSLFVPNEQGQLQPDLALSWAYDESSWTWTIHLRTDAFFHDGQPVTAEDVCCSLRTSLAKMPVPREEVQRLSIISDHAISIRLQRNDPAFAQKIWFVEILPCQEEKAFDENHPIGSGPFVFASRQGERQVVLTVNKNYYAGRPALDGVIFYYQPDQEKTWTRLLAGTTDIAREISSKNYEITRQYQDRFYFHHYTLGYYSILLYNTRDPLFADAQVRRALTRAIDRQYIVDHILNGYGRVAEGPMGVDSPFHNPDVKPLAYDPQGSLRQLQAAGWGLDSQGRFLKKNGRPFSFTLLVPAEAQVEKSVARYIQLCFNDIGVQMDIRSRPFQEIVARYLKNNDFQAVLTEFTGANLQVENVIRGWLPDGQGHTSAGNFSDPQVTHLLNQALQTDDPRVKEECLFQVDALLAGLQPGSFLYQKTAFDVMSRRFSLAHPLSLSSDGAYWLRLASLKQPE